MKRHIKQFLLPVLMLTALLGAVVLVACGEEHVHDYTYRTEVVEPTCVQGYTKHICKCGEFTTDTFTDPVQEHLRGEPVRENEVPATCLEEGGYEEIVYCVRCHEQLEYAPRTTEKAPHTYHKGVCSVCGVKVEDNERIQSNVFTIDYTASPVRIFCNFPNDTESVDLATAFTSTSKITWKVYSDLEGKHPIDSRVDLNESETKTAYLHLFYESAPDYYTACYVEMHRSVQFTYSFLIGDQETEPETKDESEPITPPPLPERFGYDFIGWQVYVGDIQSEPVFSVNQEDFPYPFLGQNFSYPKETIIFYAYFEPKHYQIDYELDGGENSPLNLPDYRYSEAPVTLTFYAPEKKGYAFMGWYQDANLGKELAGGVDENNNQCWILRVEGFQDITVYAKWEIVTYTVTYVLNGGENHPDNPETYTIDTPVTPLFTPTREGYIFDGWYEDEDCTMRAEQLGGLENLGDKTFYAKWIEITVEED